MSHIGITVVIRDLRSTILLSLRGPTVLLSKKVIRIMSSIAIAVGFGLISLVILLAILVAIRDLQSRE